MVMVMVTVSRWPSAFAFKSGGEEAKVGIELYRLGWQDRMEVPILHSLLWLIGCLQLKLFV